MQRENKQYHDLRSEPDVYNCFTESYRPMRTEAKLICLWSPATRPLYRLFGPSVRAMVEMVPNTPRYLIEDWLASPWICPLKHKIIVSGPNNDQSSFIPLPFTPINETIHAVTVCRRSVSVYLKPHFGRVQGKGHQVSNAGSRPCSYKLDGRWCRHVSGSKSNHLPQLYPIFLGKKVVLPKKRPLWAIKKYVPFQTDCVFFSFFLTDSRFHLVSDLSTETLPKIFIKLQLSGNPYPF